MHIRKTEYGTVYQKNTTITTMPFDWYMPPADKFKYESDFQLVEQDGFASLNSLDTIFHQSRLTQTEFLQIWQLIDIRLENCLDRTQFVYFMHCVNQRRRGFEIPVGLPLKIKEEFLAIKRAASPTRMYVRPKNNVRDMGLSTMKSVPELETELKQMGDMLRASEQENKRAVEKLHELEDCKAEMEELASYYNLKAAAAKEANANHSILPVQVLLESIRTMEQDRDYLQSIL